MTFFFVADAELMMGPGNKQFLKEYTLVQRGVDGGIRVLLHALLHPPCEWARLSQRQKHTCCWQSHRLHGLQYEEGTMSVAELRDLIHELVPTGDTVYVKGEEKADLMGECFDRVFCPLDDDEAPCTDNCTVDEECPHHHKKRSVHSCSKNKALFYAGWLEENPPKPPVI